MLRDIAPSTAPQPTSTLRDEWPMGIVFLMMLGLRIAYGAVRQLVPDEAYYWLWSRHLAAGYLDHPPMVAFLIRLGTTLAGQSEVGVRWPGSVLAIGTAAVMWLLARHMLGPSLARWVAWILLLGPMLNVMGTIITPDTPLLFFAACNLACAIRAVDGEPRWWIGFGISLGLGLASKYTMVVPGFAVTIALLTSSQGRREFARPWVWLAALIGLAIFSPVIWWNATHQWVSFEFQLHHGTAVRVQSISQLAHLNDLFAYIGGQAAMFTPVLFVMGIIALVSNWRRFSQLNLAERILLLTASFPLILFGLTSLKRRPEPNWPLMAYLPLTIVLVKYVFEQTAKFPTGRALAWLRLGLGVAIFATAFLHLPEMLFVAVPKMRQKSLDEQFGWRELAQRIDSVSPGAPVFSDTYQLAAELSFYLPGQPQVWTLSVDRPTMLDYLPGRPDPGSLSKLVFVTSGLRVATDPPISGLEAFPHQTIILFAHGILRHTVRQCSIVVAQR
jgi:4-amino-4-deoxy-L-arabinose transferase-like glycosyltransferase